MDVRLCIGACGSGETYRLKLMVASAARLHRGYRFIVADVNGEWPRSPVTGERGPLLNGSAIAMQRVASPAHLRSIGLRSLNILRYHGERDHGVLVEWFDEIARACIDRSGVVLVAPEIWRYAPERSKLPPSLAVVVHEHRHRALGLWCDAQSYPELSKEVVRRARYHVIHGTGAREDLDYLARFGGRELSDAVLDAARLNRERGPGHHVVLDTSHALPPFPVRGPGGAPVSRPAASRRVPPGK